VMPVGVRSTTDAAVPRQRYAWFQDLVALLADWGCLDPHGPCPGDVNRDGETGFEDLPELLSTWGSLLLRRVDLGRYTRTPLSASIAFSP
jgi:hypothetical protein